MGNLDLGALNPSQRQAVLAIDGPVLIIAGAGSGKTRVLTYRIAYMLATGKAKPNEILAVTFTNKAANEMRERVANLVGSNDQLPWIGTFHSICATILRREASHLGYRNDFTILDERDSLSLLRTIVAETRLPNCPAPEVVRLKIEQAKNECLSPSEFLKLAEGKPSDFSIAQLYKIYQERLRSLNAVDFGDLILLTYELFRQHEHLLRRWQERAYYLLIDEYQDTNRAQYLVVRELAKSSLNICAVGDEDQSIYSWRGADVRNILDFERDFPHARVFKLEQNYRSTKTILKAAQSLIRHNRIRKPKELWTSNETGAPVTWFTAADEREEAEFVAWEIERLRNEGLASYDDVVIFYRINAQSRPFEEALLRRRMPYRLVGGVPFYERREIRDLLAYLRVLANPQDDLSLIRLTTSPPRGVGEKTLQTLRELAAAKGISLFEAMGYAEGSSEISLKIAKIVGALYRWLQELQRRAITSTVKSLLEEIITQTDFLSYLDTLLESEARRQNVAELLSAADVFDKEHGPGHLSEFLEHAALMNSADVSQGDSGVTLMTLHASKGLEYPVVFIVGLEEGLFPHIRSQDEPSEIEEERRLFYVGMTRARRLLYLSNARSRELHGTRQRCQPSRFLAELDPALLRKVDCDNAQMLIIPKTPNLSKFRDQSSLHQESSSEPRGRRLWIGARVIHQTFGAGYVRRIEGQGDALKAWVQFDRGGLKLLALKYARLEVIAGEKS